MFQNSILLRPEIPCVLHSKTKITSVCTDLTCTANPLLCPNCLSDFDVKNKHHYHENQIKPSIDALNEIAQLIQKQRLVTQKLFKQTAGRKQNDELIRWQQDRQRHYVSIENHVNSLMYQLEQQTRNLYKFFEQAMQESVKLIRQSLDQYLKTYRQNFEIFTKIIEPVVNYGRSHRYFSNVYNITFKLLTQKGKKGPQWLTELKNGLATLQKMNVQGPTTQQALDRATTYMNAMVDALPTVTIDEKQLQQSIRQFTYETLKNCIRICDLKSLHAILASVPQMQKKPSR